MVWLLVGLGALILGIIVYYIASFFKKKFAGKVKEKKPSFFARMREKKQQKIEQNATQDVKNPNVFTPEGDLFVENENAINLNEDPDTRVDYKNFDMDGLFEESKAERQETDLIEKDAFSNNIDEMFEHYFADDRAEKHYRTSSEDRDFDSEENGEEINRFFEEYNKLSNSANSIQTDFDSLSPEMKALMISNFLDRKDDN